MDEPIVRPAGDDRSHRAGGRVDLRRRLADADLPIPFSPLIMNAKTSPTDHLAPVFAQYPIEVVHAEGVWLHDPRWTAHPRSLRRPRGRGARLRPSAMARRHVEHQAAACNFQSNAVPMDVRTRGRPPSSSSSRRCRYDSVFFVNSGAEANENALKMAFRMTRRPHVAAIEGSFHGRTAAAGAITWRADGKWYEFPRAPFDVSYIPRRDLAAIAAHVTDKTAAVIVEPVQGEGGIHPATPGVPRRAARCCCDEVGALLIFDEVQIGVGRSGFPFAANMYGVAPDMITTAKALGNGFPCAALLMSPRVTAALRMEGLGTTFGGGPMACAAIEAVIEAIETEGLLENVRRGLEVHRRDLHGRPGDRAPGRGLPAWAAHQPASEGDPAGAARARHPRWHQRRSEHRAAAAALHPA